MRIAFVTPKMVIGGAESYIIVKSRYLIKRGYTVIVISTGGGNVANLPDGVKHFTLNNIDKAPYELSGHKRKELIRNLEEILLVHRIDLVEAHNTYPIYYGALVSCKMGIACLYNLLNELSHRKQLITNILVKEFSQAGCYFTLTEQMNRFVVSEVGHELKPVVLPIPVEGIEVSNGDCGDKNYILTVCRFASDKLYVLSLIEGFAEAVMSGGMPQGIVLKIVGDGELREDIERRVTEANVKIGHKAVDLLGFKCGDELEQLFCACTLYVGMGTTMLKAAQLGKAVMCVGLEPPLSYYVWGFWGENPERDVHNLAEQTNDIANGIVFAKALQVVTDKDRLKILGDKAKALFNSYYELNHIMWQWEKHYERISKERYILPARIKRRLEFRAFVLHPVWSIFQFIKRLR